MQDTLKLTLLQPPKPFVVYLFSLLFHDGGRYHIETSPLIFRANQWTGFYMVMGVQKIAPEENCPPVRVRVWFRINVGIRAGGQFSLGAIFLEPW